MNGFILMIPLFLIRFGLIGLINKAALSRAAHFAPLEGKEKIAYIFYQLSNIFIILYPLFTKIKTEIPIFCIGLFIYILGVVILAVSSVQFAKPDEIGINVKGIYKFSRNPMYIGYFIYFLGCALLSKSIPLLIALLIFQISAHWIILSEERWCINKFGNDYKSYMDRVRRYF